MLVANLVLFGVAVVVGQLLSYSIMIAEESKRWLKVGVLLALIVISIAFWVFSYMPPRLFLWVRFISVEQSWCDALSEVRCTCPPTYLKHTLFLFEDPLLHDYGILEVCGE